MSNVPLNAIGIRAPWDEEEYILEVYYCDNNCGTKVKDEHQWCDACLIANAEACGDWDDEALAAKQRTKTTQQ